MVNRASEERANSSKIAAIAPRGFSVTKSTFGNFGNQELNRRDFLRDAANGGGGITSGKFVVVGA